jgi:tRNA pseudouridine13 synthase
MIIKHVPEDFIVEEIPLNEWADAGPYTIFRLTKINLNTEHAVSIISKRFNIPNNLIKYSGTKDKNARTIQYVSIPSKQGIDGLKIDEEDIKLEHVGYSEEPLSLGTLKGNKFIITVRELDKKDIHALNARLDILNSKDSKKFIIPNYFDEQRFSANNYNIGLNILKRNYKLAADYMCKSKGIYADAALVYWTAHPTDYVGALQHVPKRILILYIHSVQSHIFNEALSRLLLDHSQSSERDDILHYIADYVVGSLGEEKILGKLVFYNYTEDYAELTNSLELVGFNTAIMNHYVKKVLEEAGLSPRDFIIRALPDLSVEGVSRECFVDVINFEHRILDDRVIMEFELPKGSYATIVIKALFGE